MTYLKVEHLLGQPQGIDKIIHRGVGGGPAVRPIIHDPLSCIEKADDGFFTFSANLCSALAGVRLDSPRDR